MIDLVEQEQYYNGKIFVVDSNSFTFEAGHIYEFVNGRVKINGLKYPTVFPPLKNFEAVKDYLGIGSYVRAMEVKED